MRLRRVEGFKVEESCPHVSLYVYGDHRARELGREVQKSWRKDWVKTQGHWVSSDGEIELQWGKKVFSQPPIVQVLPLKKMREACNFHHRYTSTMRQNKKKKIQKIPL